MHAVGYLLGMVVMSLSLLILIGIATAAAGVLFGLFLGTTLRTLTWLGL